MLPGILRGSLVGMALSLAFAIAGALPAFALDSVTERIIALETATRNIDYIWTLVAAALVLLMQAGFLLLEAGMVRSKNSINVAQKNLLDFVVSVVVFALVGFMIAFGQAGDGMPVGSDNRTFMLSELTPWEYAFFVFQVMFCGTAATIVSGAVAERMKLTAYVLCTALMAGLVYPVFVHWAWGAALFNNDTAFLSGMGFVDFAGSTVVHATGAWFALAACLIMGPRLGRFRADGTPVRIHGHSSVLATTGCLLLFVGWIGFNGGSTTAGTPDIAHIIANTVLAAGTGAAAGYFLSLVQEGRVAPEKTISGMLGGLVAITAGCSVLEAQGAMIMGVLGGAIAVLSNWWLEHRLKVDDAVGAIGVHGFAGVVGTVGLVFLAPLTNLPAGDRTLQLQVQVVGVGLNFLWSFLIGLAFFYLLDRVLPIRVAARDEEAGLNEAEHATRLGVGHVEEALSSLVSGTADLNMRLPVDNGDEAETLTRLFNELMDNIQSEEFSRITAAEAARSAEEAERLSALANSAFEAIVISVDGRIVDGNRALEELLGLPLAELKSRQLQEFFDPADWPRLEQEVGRSEASLFEASVIDSKGKAIPVEYRGREIVYRGKTTRVSAVSDLRERKKAEARIRHLAHHDPLTDLPNRAVFQERLTQAVANCARNGTKVAVLLVDLDRFKDINDLYGHPSGDAVIRETGARLKSLVRGNDTVARLGGDEFGIIQMDVEFSNQAADLA
ncbi:MAG: ammonium transporter, partial [Hyphomicrobiales bacterium]